FIPFTPQTDPNNFPVWQENAPPGESGCPYPKMLTRPCTEQDRIEWTQKNRRRDPVTKEEFYNSVAPVLHSRIPILTTPAMLDAGLCKKVGVEVIVQDADEERQVRILLGLDEPSRVPAAIEIPIRASEVEAKPKPNRRRRRIAV